MSYAGMTRGDFFSRTSLIHLYDGSSTPNTANKYINFNKYDVRKLIDEQVKLGARSFLWIVCGTMTLPDDETVLVEGEYRGEDGNFVPLSPCLLYTSPSPRDRTRSRMPSSA